MRFPIGLWALERGSERAYLFTVDWNYVSKSPSADS